MENQRFNKIVQKTLKWEGGYVNDPHDAGGETNFGISKRAYPNLNIKTLTKNEAIAIYLRDYWLKPCINQINDDTLAATVFDLGVNVGPQQAVKFLQRAANVANTFFGPALQKPPLTVDGVLGPKTLNAVNILPQSALTAAVRQQATQYYAGLKNAPRYLKGWLNRLNDY